MVATKADTAAATIKVVVMAVVPVPVAGKIAATAVVAVMGAAVELPRAVTTTMAAVVAAAAVGTNENTVKSRMRYALKALRQQLRAHHRAEDPAGDHTTRDEASSKRP